MSTPAPTLSPAPTESLERTLLNALFTNSHSLPALANSLNLTVIDLLDLISSPAIQSKLIAYEQAAAHAVRVAASVHLSKLLDVLDHILDSHTTDLKPLESRTDEAAITHRRRERVHIRKAATLVLRLTRFSPLAPDSILAARPAPSTRGGAFQAPLAPAAHKSNAVLEAPHLNPAPSPFPQPEMLNVSRRGQSESSSVAPGSPRPFSPHPERVLVPSATQHARRAIHSPASSLLPRAGAALSYGPAP